MLTPVLANMKSGGFSYIGFLKKRFFRLWPMVVIASAVCLLVGFVGMLPDDYENLGESVVASNFFSENILLSVTTRDYWNVSNDYNPLMHLWYVGILFEFYLIFPLLIFASYKFIHICGTNKERQDYIIISIILLVSLILFLAPVASDGEKFYYIPFRLFEFMAGGLIALLSTSWFVHRGGRKIFTISIILLLLIFLSSLVNFNPNDIGTDVIKIGGKESVANESFISKQCLLLLTVLIASITLIAGGNCQMKSGMLGYFGKRSYSLFIWHQIMIAFYRYFISNKMSILFMICFFIVLVTISELTYRYIERIKLTRQNLLFISLLSLITIISGGFIYARAGVVRDVPELDIYMNKAHRGMHAEYVDRVYAYDKDFDCKNKKMNVLVQGNSYGRDMCNVFLESIYRDSINLSYIFEWNEKNKGRIANADILFIFSHKDSVPSFVWENKKPEALVYGIGTKNYGVSNGIIYSHRFGKDYTKQTVPLHPWYKNTNEQWKMSWGDYYIDFLGPSVIDGERVRVFSDEGKYISQDCYHLSQTGAKWYANRIDLKKIFDGANKK